MSKSRRLTESMASYDLHLHTYWSYDATAEPEKHFRRAREAGVRCIAITEHHHMDSADEVDALRAYYPEIRCIPAAEITATTSLGSVDLLCYGLDPRHPALQELFGRYHQWQREAGAAISAGMQAIGIDFDEEHRRQALAQYRPLRMIEEQGVTHLTMGKQCAYFLKQGWVSSEEAFQVLRRRAAEAVPSPPYPPVRELVEAVRGAGGLIVIAHPQRYFQNDDRRRMDQLREECALDGIECAHPSVDQELTPLYRDYCREHGLVSTGGSDSHTHEDITETFGRHAGKPEWLDELFERLDGRG